MLNIAKNIYAVWNSKTQVHDLPEAEIIPIGDSTNEKRKLNLVTKKYTNLHEHENIPLPGFTLYMSNRKNWGSTDQTWLIIDPRGFLTRITNQNLESILHVTGITEGLIQQKCIWARDDTETKMILVPISSPLYQDAVRNTELIEGKVSMKEVQIGDTVILQNELTGVYMGVLSLYGPINNYTLREEYKPQTFLRRQIIEVSPGKYHYQTDLKILKVLEKTLTPGTRAQSAEKMNLDIQSGTSYFTPTTNMSSSYYGMYGCISHVSTHAIPKVNITFEEINNYEATKIFYDAQAVSDIGMLALENAQGHPYLIDFPYIGSSRSTAIHSFEVCEIKHKLEPSEKISIKEPRKSIFRAGMPGNTIGLDNFKKFYKIVKHVKNETFI